VSDRSVPAKPPRYESVADIDLGAIASSVRACADAAPTAALMAVVKADGYGHGLVQSARAAIAGGASWLGTAHVAEAVALRKAGLDVPVLSWLNPPGTPLDAAVSTGIDLAVSATWALDEVVAAAERAGRPARIHLKVDTGLRRNGVLVREVEPLLDAIAKAQAAGSVEVIGAMTHFVHAELSDHALTTNQVAAFTDVLARAARRGIHPLVRHCANSAATLTRPDTHFDLVRPGIACYGLTPIPAAGPPSRFGLTPAMTLTAPVALVKDVAAGEGVSYGHLWTAERDGRIALVPIGYADGVPRAATNVAQVLLGGRRERIVGRVCMDQFLVTAGEDVEVGDEVVLFGPGTRDEPTAQEWADALETISYEVVTRIGPRVPRVYVNAPRVA
jgi:alanine racemase